MNSLITKIENATTIALLGHVRPDGDCTGVCLAVYNYIIDNYPDKKPVVYLKPVPKKFNILKGTDLVRNVDDNITYDLSISLDCGDLDRHGDLSGVFARAKDSVCIDHHKSNEGFGDFYHCEPDASSTCEIVFKFLDYDKISKTTAECLYLGIVHDTGVFKYGSTTEETMTFAGKLISKGVDTQTIIDETFYKVNYNQNRLCGYALLNSKLHFEGKVISTHITLDDFVKFNALKSDSEGIIDKLRVTEGVEVSIFAYQVNENTYKFSLRSLDYVDASLVSQHFGGGGHIRAAGFELSGNSYEEMLTTVLNYIEGVL